MAVIGAGTADRQEYDQAHRLGQLLAEQGYILICGGLGGIMEAAASGASSRGGEVVGLLPGEDVRAANPFVTRAIATGLGHMRNYLVVLNAGAAVALGGGYGTLSEIALAKKIGRPVIVLGGWSGLEGTVTADGPEQAVRMIGELLPDGP